MTDTSASSSHGSATRDWADLVSRGYAGQTVPPLTDDMRADLNSALRRAGLPHASDAGLDAAAIERVNQVLDAFELALDAVVGPRLASGSAEGSLAFRQRSEAGRPLRAYGGQ